MEEPTKTNYYDFASRFVLFSGGLGVAFVFWAIRFATMLGGGIWPLLPVSDSIFLLAIWLFAILQFAILFIPFVIFFHIRTHTILLIAVSILVPFLVLFAEQGLFPCAILYPILTFFAYRFDRRRSAVLSGLVQS